MRKIPLTQGYEALVDDADYELLSSVKWRALVNKRWPNSPVYAVREISVNGKAKAVLMHRLLAGCNEDVDHHDGNGLNNQRTNLRPSTETQNRANSKKRTGTTSRFKGVSWNTQCKRWIGSIAKDGKKFYLGLFKDEVDAAQAYNFAAEELFGEFARLNTPLVAEG